MNEHDYYVFSQICLFIGIFALILGSFILEVFEVLSYRNLLFMIFIFLIFFSIAVYFNSKGEKLKQEMLEEIKKLVNGDKE